MSKHPNIMIGLAAVALLPLGLAGCATRAIETPDRFALGRDASGERCTANRTGDPSIVDPQDKAYLLTCAGATASRIQGVITAARAVSADADADCGAPTVAEIDGVGAVTARRCLDKRLGAAVQISFARGKTRYRGTAIASAVGPLERAMVAVANGTSAEADATDAATRINVAQIAAPPQTVTAGASAGTSIVADPDVLLRQGVAFNRQGRFVEASRVLNDALSRIGSDVGAETRVNLLLEAGLADSSIRFSDAASEHFAEAKALLDQNPRLAAGKLERKRSAYVALNALNLRDFSSILAASAAPAATAVSAAENKLADPIVMADVNVRRAVQESTSNGLSMIAAASNETAWELQILEANRQWARSFALLARGSGVDASAGALDGSATIVARLLESGLDAAPYTYLVAQIERQGGRIEARRAAALNGAARNAAAALAVGRFDCAEATLTGRRPADPLTCMIKLSPRARLRLESVANAGVSPITAETQIERAAVRFGLGESAAAVRPEFDAGLEALVASGRGGSIAPAGYESYLRLLADTGATDQFFRAVQAIGEPGAARQLSQLQAVVTADPKTASLLRERADLAREIPALRYQIDALQQVGADAARRSELEALRDRREARLRELDERLVEGGKLNAIDDRPATIAELQRALRPEEVYFKIADIRGSMFGMVIGKDRATAYAIDASPQLLGDLVEAIRTSIRSGEQVEANGTLSRAVGAFPVAAASTLFQLIAGPAQQQLRQAKQMVYDPAGPLSNLPAGVLVTDVASLKAYTAAVRRAPKDAQVVNDYSNVAFLARDAEISTALSARSFLDARGLRQARSVHPFLGLGQHAAPASLADGQVRMMTPGCTLQRSELEAVSRANPPISAAKLTMAATALGVPDAPRIIGADFTDDALQARTDLGDYEVLHFATHGLPETRFECADIPPALLTTIGGPGSDGFLSFDEIAGLKLDANLVVLAACDTSAGTTLQTARRAGQEESGRALDGLVRAFLAANARAVLATYWKVSVEQDSDMLFDTFYRRGRTATIGGSLQAAQSALIQTKRYSHPYFWGAYFLVGDASKTMLSTPAAAGSATAGR